MKPLIEEKKQAIKLRKKGLTYSEINDKIGVSNASLSLWLRNISLNNKQRDRINLIQKQAVQVGAIMRRSARIRSENVNNSLGIKEVATISLRELWLIGISLYWAEGTKQNQQNISQGVKFSNSDPAMINLFIIWLTKIVNVNIDVIVFELYIHESVINQKNDIIHFWSKELHQPVNKFDRIYIKHNHVRKTYSRTEYRGVMRLVVKKSATLNRRITGWQQGIINGCRVV